MPSVRKLTCLALILAAIGFLYPGVTQPVLTLSGQLEKSQVAELGIDMLAGDDGDPQTRRMLTMVSSFLGLDQLEGRLDVYRNTRSILGMAQELRATGNSLVAILIVTFSVVVPVSKLLLQAVALLLPLGFVHPLWRVNAALSKWSMADVFVMAMLIAFMAGRASGDMGDLLLMQAQLERGFYFFLAYCLFSIAAGAVFLRIMKPPVAAHTQPGGGEQALGARAGP